MSSGSSSRDQPTQWTSQLLQKMALNLNQLMRREKLLSLSYIMTLLKKLKTQLMEFQLTWLYTELSDRKLMASFYLFGLLNLHPKNKKNKQKEKKFEKVKLRHC